MSKIIERLKRLEDEKIENNNLEEIEIIEDEKPEKLKNLKKLIFLFLVLSVSIYGGFKLAYKFFHVKNENTIVSKKIIAKSDAIQVDTISTKEPKLVVFAGNKDFEKILLKKFESEPKNSIHANNLAIFYFENNKLDLALKYAQKAITLDPENPYFWNNLGIVLTELKLYDDAEKCFKKSIEKKQGEGIFYYNLANLYEREGKISLAKENYLLYLTKSDRINPKMINYVREKLKKGFNGYF